MYKWPYKDMESIKFEWDSSKNEINIIYGAGYWRKGKKIYEKSQS